LTRVPKPSSYVPSMDVSGHLQVVERASGRRWYALWRDASGRHRKMLGRAWVKPHGTTARGATKWRSADGSKPGDDWLTPGEAEDALNEILAAAKRAPRQRREVVTFSAACADWLAYVEHERRRKPSTVRDCRNTVRSALEPAFGASTPVDAITTRDIDAWREQQLVEGRLSPRTVQKNLVLLHGILERAKKRGWIAVNPAADAERVVVRRSGDFNVLEPEQVYAVARAAREPMFGALIMVAAFTGLRTGELRALRWRDVDFARRSVFVRKNFAGDVEVTPKSERIRSVPLVDQAAAALDQLSRRGAYTGPDDLVFCDELGQRLAGDRARDEFYFALEQAGLGDLRRREPPIVFHDLRHTFGSLAVQVFPITDVKAFMGHQDISTTMVYVHHVPRHDAADRLSALLSGGVRVVGDPR
jgi:integrase